VIGIGDVGAAPMAGRLGDLAVIRRIAVFGPVTPIPGNFPFEISARA
jgi:hypothetical protein